MTGVNKWVDATTQPTVFGCDLTNSSNLHSVLFSDSYSGDVVVCGDNYDWYGEFYYCDGEHTCSGDTAPTDFPSCSGFDFECASLVAYGDFRVSMQSPNATARFIYNKGGCPTNPDDSGNFASHLSSYKISCKQSLLICICRSSLCLDGCIVRVQNK